MRERRPDRSEYWISLHTIEEPLKPVKSRPDINTACIVEHGIILFHTRGAPQATDFFKKNKVPPDVVVRVLFHPSRRRKKKSVTAEDAGTIPYWSIDISR